jgi:hypothetical protein
LYVHPLPQNLLSEVGRVVTELSLVFIYTRCMSHCFVCAYLLWYAIPSSATAHVLDTFRMAFSGRGFVYDGMNIDDLV